MKLPIDAPAERPILIAGPTASGKSALALRYSEAQGREVINADALQVYTNWRVLSARPDAADLARAPHALYGHVAWDAAYSAGHWLRDLAPRLGRSPAPVIVGGTGLYFSALTEGLSQIPPVPEDVRARGDAMSREEMIAALDPQTAGAIDLANRARVQRAWEVLESTGKPLVAWQADKTPPLCPLDEAIPLLLDAPKDWLTPRIASRFDQMLGEGALDEARENLARYDPALPSMKPIGAPELVAYLRGQMTLDDAREAATIATRQYAKRQRTWFRARMRDWTVVSAAAL
ncbi:tRNA (adenosine(37)-N6)-dimethylallyltransferase MiaA [Poseidonocella sedimentorum]|uniref:tRNA (adenosine(37)-N6)-dimethylallyltransferase MiaA n=1 Tax=Poseidonocella sedimentorum TaxID=871652 RepID=UPI000B86F3EC|nr:tRNA (adenosine(37)-N6)-dimethylallyltransferase MiaA [Poseidonocella sedimentorum]